MGNDASEGGYACNDQYVGSHFKPISQGSYQQSADHIAAVSAKLEFA
jgi:hypothetical protein